MVKVITYGTYDYLHVGHVKLLERAKALGDYLIVGVTGDDFDKTRGKINVGQSLVERIEAVKATGLADEIIVEEYIGQKIDDIKKYNIDIFTVGSDWEGKFDYLNEYCKVVYLPRTEGVSSTSIRSARKMTKLAIIGENRIADKFKSECSYVNGMEVVSSYDEADAVYVVNSPKLRYETIKKALNEKKHVLCESPVTLTVKQYTELSELAKKNGLILMEAIKTAYSTAYNRLLVLAKSGAIGKIVSIDSTCTSLIDTDNVNLTEIPNSICEWGPTAMLPVFQLLGTDYEKKTISTMLSDKEKSFDLFTKINFEYKDATASIKVGRGVKSEGSLVISGTKGYIYVPSPWWKTDYFEVRYESSTENKRYFYQLDGEGIRYTLVAFHKAIENTSYVNNIATEVTKMNTQIVEDFYNSKDLRVLGK